KILPLVLISHSKNDAPSRHPSKHRNFLKLLSANWRTSQEKNLPIIKNIFSFQPTVGMGGVTTPLAHAQFMKERGCPHPRGRSGSKGGNSRMRASALPFRPS